MHKTNKSFLKINRYFYVFKKEEKNNCESSPLLHLIFKDSVLIIPDFHEGTEAYYLSH